MASQRIVLTSPWKLGLFVFLLVVGCGFGLIYAYLRYLGGTMDFADRQQLRTFYIICGSVAGLGMLGYVSVVSSARPMVGIAKDKQKREKLYKKLSQIKDIRKTDPDEFNDEPVLAKLVERWSEAVRSADEAEQAAQSQAETIAELNARIESSASDASTQAPEAEGEASIGADLEQRRELQRQLFGLARGIAQSARTLNHAHDGTDLQSVSEPLQRASARLAESRGLLEDLSEQSNRLAIQAALQVSRVGEPHPELMQVTDDIRQISTRYQRLASELRLCEGDHEQLQAALEKGLVESAAGATHDVAVQLVRHATAIKELAATLLPDEAPNYASSSVTPIVAEPVTDEEPVEEPEQPVQQSAGIEIPHAEEAADDAIELAGTEEAESVYDLEQFGGRELDESGEPIYDLREFEAVEL